MRENLCKKNYSGQQQQKIPQHVNFWPRYVSAWLSVPVHMHILIHDERGGTQREKTLIYWSICMLRDLKYLYFIMHV